MTVSHNGKEERPTDLGALWTTAVKDYAQKTGHNIDHMASQNLNDVMAATSKELKTFGGFRHDGGKVDKVRSAFQGHLDNMKTCMDGFQTIGAAAGAFPPAMPVGIVFSACGRLLSAFAAASAQYDKVEAFFNHASKFFERLSLLEGKADSKPMALAIVRIFSAQLSICGVAQRLASSGRVKTFFNMLWNMEDPQLSSAYAAMQTTVDELGATVGMASYSAIRDTHEDVNRLDAQIANFRSTLKEDVYLLYTNNLAIDDKITEGFIAVGQKQDQSYEMQMYMAQTTEQILKAVTRTSASQDIVQDKGDVGDAAVKAVAHIRSFFEDRPDRYPDFAKVYDANLEQHEFLQRVMVASTNEWLYSDTTFLKWRSTMNQVVWLQAPDGTGKTFLTCSVYQTATTQWGESINCGYFYFFPNRSSIETALACIVMQVVSRNSRYAEKVAAKLREEAVNLSSNSPDISTWERFFASTFTSNDKPERLILFIDGFDEAQENQKHLLVNLADYSRNNESRISILLTTRRSSIPSFGSSIPSVITITKERVLPGLTILIRKRYGSRPELRRLSKAVKKAICKSLLEHADGMLYADHMLQRLGSLGREGVILRALDNMPGSLTGLFRLFEEECIKGRTKEQFEAIKALFVWMTYSGRPLTVSELSTVIAHTSQFSQGGDHQQKLESMQAASLLHNENQVIDIEEELLGRSRRFLRISQQLVSSESATKEEDEDEEPDDDESEIADADNDPRMVAYRDAEVVFQDFALRRFLLYSLHDHREPEQSLRVEATRAHIQMLETCVDLILGLGWSKSPRSIKPNGLQHYALHFWQQHFKHLCEPLDGEIVARVLNIFRRIALNARDFTAALLRYGPSLEAVLPKREQGQVQWYDMLTTLAQTAHDQYSDVLPEDICQWLSRPEQELILLPLAEGYHQAWMAETVAQGYVDAYQAVRLIIRLTRSTELGFYGADEVEEISHYAGLFLSPAHEAAAIRAIALTYWWNHLAERNTEGLDVPFVVEQLNKSVALANTPQDKIITQHLLGTIYRMLMRETDAITAYSEAIHEVEKAIHVDVDSALANFMTAPEMIEIRNLTFAQMALACKRNGQYQEALDLRVKLKSFAAWAYPMEPGIIELCWELDPSGVKAMTMLKTWSRKERKSYFRVYGTPGITRRPADRQRIIRQTRAPRRSGEMDLYMGWLLEGKPDPYQQHAAACIYEIVLHDEGRAEEVRKVIFNLQPAVYDNNRRAADVKAVQQEHWRREAAALYRRFQATSGWKEKKVLLGKMESLPNLPFQHRDELQESQVGMLRAYMLRALGSNREYQEAMEILFTVCIGGLEDGVSYNDGPSLRLLTKVLSLLPNLERDACIAYAAQFSILDRDIAGEDHSGGDEDEDLTGVSYPCDGCRRRLSQWSSTQYMCLVCPNLDLCESCYEQEQQSHHRQESIPKPDGEVVWEDELWHSFCDSSHAYIKGPMKDWKGVRGGYIRIGEEKVEVKEWLRGLKEERWKQAWEDLWSSRNQLRNIGYE